jgi:hypothetical protein
MSYKAKIKDYVIVFLIVMTIIFTIQSFTTSLEIKDLQNGQVVIQSKQDANRDKIIGLIINSTDKCLTTLSNKTI